MDLNGQIGRIDYLCDAGLPAILQTYLLFCRPTCDFAGLPTFGEATQMTGHTALFKADRLPSIRTGLSKQAILIFMMSFVAFILHIPLF